MWAETYLRAEEIGMELATGESEPSRPCALSRSLTEVANGKRNVFFPGGAREEAPSYAESGFPQRKGLRLRNS